MANDQPEKEFTPEEAERRDETLRRRHKNIMHRVE